MSPPKDGSSDIVVAHVDSEDIVCLFRESLRGFQERFQKRFDFKLFMPLLENDRHKEEGLRVPPNNDAREFDTQLLNLATLLPDSIDKKQLLTYVGGRTEHGQKKKGSIAVLKEFLSLMSLPTDIIQPLHRVQDLRSSGAAHRRGANYAKHVAKHGLNEACKEEFFRKLLVDMTRALDALC